MDKLSKSRLKIAKNMPPEIKKSYNPFKMWGSYVVVVFLVFLALSTFIQTQNDCGAGNKFSEVFHEFLTFGRDNSSCDGLIYTVSEFLVLPILLILLVSNNVYLAFFVSIFFGFLIGWGVHSLFRKFSK